MTLASDGLPPLREVVARYGLDARKALGQNFLFDLNLTAKISTAKSVLHGKPDSLKHKPCGLLCNADS